MSTTLATPSATATNLSTVPDHYAVAERDLSVAYSDCHRHHPAGYTPERSLRFCSPVTVSLAEAKRLLARYVRGYNEFAPRVLDALPPDCRVRLAREGSVCLYVETTAVFNVAEMRRVLRCDELDLWQVWNDVRTYRAWWD